MQPTRKVAVVGGGIIGVSSAVRAIETVPGIEVTLIADRFSPNTTGDGSAGFWNPYLLGNAPASLVRFWCEKTFEFLLDLIKSPQCHDYGVGLLPAYHLYETPVEPPIYADTYLEYRAMQEKELALFPSKYRYGEFAMTLYAECTKLIPMLMKRFQSKGGKIIQKKLDSLDQLIGKYDIIINCPGVEAAKLVPDPKVFPIRGQVMRVRAPWIKCGVLAGDDYYILPNSEEVICGGTHQEGNWSTEVDPVDSDVIWIGCTSLIPSLKNAEVLREWVGLRPGRSEPRLEKEILNTEKGHLEGTVLPAENFNAERAAAKLRKAMKGIGTDERAIIDVLVTHSNSQRQEIKRKYKSLYGRDLVEDIKSELGGNFEDLCVALLTPQIIFLADCLYEAVKGVGTDEKCIIEILSSQENREIDDIKSAFKQKYNKDLEEWLCSDTSGHFRTLVRSLLSAEREETVEIDFEMAEMDAQKLFDGGVGKLGVDDDVFAKILCSRSRAQLQETLDAYERIAGHPLTAAIRSEFSGDTQDILLAIVYCMKDKNRYFAKQLKDSLKGLGTDDAALIRILVSRSEIDLEDVKEAYILMYQKDLAEDVAEDTSGDYRKALLRILQP